MDIGANSFLFAAILIILYYLFFLCYSLMAKKQKVVAFLKGAAFTVVFFHNTQLSLILIFHSEVSELNQ